MKLLWITQKQLLLAKKREMEYQSRLISNLGHNYGNISGIAQYNWNQISYNAENIWSYINQITELSNSNDGYNNINGENKLHLKILQVKEEIQKCMRYIVKGRNVAEISQLILHANVKNLCVNIRKPEFQPMNIRNILIWIPHLFISSNRVSTVVDKNMPQLVYIERSVFFNCLLNILSNALKYTNGCVSIKASYSNMQLTMCVSDEGPGIKEEDLERIFERSVRLDTNSYGLGLGLHSVRESLEWLNTECHVESKSGHGASFWFTLSDVRGEEIQEEKGGHLMDEIKNPMNSDTNNIELRKFRDSCNNNYNHLVNTKDDMVWNTEIFQTTFEDDGIDAIKMFFSEEGDIVDRLTAALEQDRYTDILSFIHKYKTSCQIIGAMRLYKLCKQIELAKGKVDISMFKTEVAALKECLNKYCDKKNLEFSVLIIEDNMLQMHVLESQLKLAFSNSDKKLLVHFAVSNNPNEIGKIGLEKLMSYNQIYDMVLIDNQLGVQNIDKAQYFGTDVIRLYKNWLNNDNIGIVEKKKKLFESQVVHLFSFNAEETLKQAGIDFHKIPWLKRCPFSKPPLRQELEILNLRMYPRHQI